MIYAHEQREKKAVYVGPRPGFPELDASLSERMDSYLHQRNLTSSLARINGWYPARYQDAPRIVIPCSNSAGVPYFQARDMSGKARLRYASPPASRDDSIVILWPQEKAKGTVVVEGPMCALAAADLGFLGIALMGCQPSSLVLDRVVNFAKTFQPVILIPDADHPEMGAQWMSWLAQHGVRAGIRVPIKKDLADMERTWRKRFLN